MQHQHQHLSASLLQQTRREGAESVEGIVGENGCRAQVLREQARNLLSQSRLDVESRQERAGSERDGKNEDEVEEWCDVSHDDPSYLSADGAQGQQCRGGGGQRGREKKEIHSQQLLGSESIKNVGDERKEGEDTRKEGVEVAGVEDEEVGEEGVDWATRKGSRGEVCKRLLDRDD